MARAAKPIPEGYHTVTPHLVIRDAAKAIEFYKKAFGAEERFRMPGPDGKLMHAEIKIGDSIVMMSDEFPQMGNKSPKTLGGNVGGLMIYTKDVDAAFAQAIAAGATEKSPPTDMFWGDRFCHVEDPFGHGWSIATHIEDVPAEDMAERMKKSMSQN
jgi:uncharacterized glyoxalase superfamily protein PhnB